DLVYHLMVLWRAKGLPLDALWAELDRRFGRKPRDLPADRRSSEVG
ncbi:MAG: phosphoribosyl-ATP pyrophosphatase, partial [Longimicrobiaceae bacterium]